MDGTFGTVGRSFSAFVAAVLASPVAPKEPGLELGINLRSSTDIFLQPELR